LLLLVRILPEGFLLFVLKNFVFFFSLLGKRYNRVLRNNLRQAFPELSSREQTRLRRSVYLHFSRLLADNLSLLTGKRNINKKTLKISGLEILESSLKQGRGVILFSAHLGNWELIPFLLAGKTGRRITNIARPMDNPLVEGLVSKFREHPGTAIVYKKNALRVILARLKNNEMVGVLIDQNTVPKEGCFVDFFGRPATVNPVMVQLSLKKSIPLIGAFLHYDDADAVHLEIGPKMPLQDYQDSGGLNRLLQDMTGVIENKIRAHPEQWLWFHNRWKTKPQGEHNEIR